MLRSATSHQPFVNSAGSEFAVLHSHNGGSIAACANAIASCKNIGQAGFKVIADLDETFFGFQIPHLGDRRFLLADGFDDLIDRKMENGAGNGFWRRAAGGIGFTQSHANTFEKFDRAVFGMELDGLDEKFEGDAFTLDEIIFVGIGGHFIFGAAVNHGDASGAEAFGNGGAIDGGVTGADDDNIGSYFQIRRVQFAQFDIFEAVEDQIFAGNAEMLGVAQGQR